MKLNQKIEIYRLSGYMERIEAILHEMQSFKNGCSKDTCATVDLTVHHLSNAMDELAIGILNCRRDEPK